MDKQEKIVCQAYELEFYNDKGYLVKKRQFLFVNDCSEIYKAITDCYDAFIGDDFQDIGCYGFITSKNRFVGSIEAQQVAIESGQYVDPIPKIKNIKDEIENIYDSIKRARTQTVVYGLKKHLKDAKAQLKELEEGYQGAEFRVEDLYKWKL